MSGINGWYYDTQLNNKLTSVTLHSNKWYNESLDNGKGGFENWDKCKGDNGFGPNGGKTDNDAYATHAAVKETGGGCGYGIDPICKSILAEDFNVTISNTWSDFGGDPVQELWNGARVKFAPYVKNIGEILNVFDKKNEEARQNPNNGKITTWITDFISNLSNKARGFADKYDINVDRFLNKALISQGTRFSYYGGTGVSFGNLGMKFTLFPKWDNNKFISVTDQINKLYPYFIGRLERFDEVDSLLKNWGDANLQNTQAYEFLKKCFMWQSPPNDYKAEIFDIDVTQEGTLKLKFGCQYELANLLCSDMMLNFSKSMVKSPENSTLSPLYCDVALNLRPATKFTDQSLKKFISGLNNNGGLKDDITDMSRKLKNALDTQEQNFDSTFGTSLRTNYLEN